MTKSIEARTGSDRSQSNSHRNAIELTGGYPLVRVMGGIVIRRCYQSAPKSEPNNHETDWDLQRAKRMGYPGAGWYKEFLKENPGFENTVR